MVTDPFRHDDAAYVLGALSAQEHAAFEAHLETCAECRARVADARAAAGLLAPGGRVHLAPVAAADPTTPRHDPAALADALAAVLAGGPTGRDAVLPAGTGGHRT